MNYYDTLNVHPQASDSEIKAAFRKLIKQYHPDKNPSVQAREITQRLNVAYDVLSNPQKRALYDRSFHQYTAPEPVEMTPQEVYRQEYIRRKNEIRKEEKAREAQMRLVVFRLGWALSLPVLAFATLLLVDIYIPATQYTEIPQMGWQQRAGKYNYVSYMRTEHFTFKVPHSVHVNYDYYAVQKTPVVLSITPMFKLVKTIDVIEENAMIRYNLLSFPVFVWLMFICAGYTAYHKKYSPLHYALSYLHLLMLGFVFITIFL